VMENPLQKYNGIEENMDVEVLLYWLRNNLDEKFNTLILILLCHSCWLCVKKELEVDVYETSAEGNLLKKIDSFSVKESSIIITLNPSQKFQTITGLVVLLPNHQHIYFISWVHQS
jgi:hypothetical protein